MDIKNNLSTALALTVAALCITVAVCYKSNKEQTSYKNHIEKEALIKKEYLRKERESCSCMHIQKNKTCENIISIMHDNKNNYCCFISMDSFNVRSTIYKGSVMFISSSLAALCANKKLKYDIIDSIYVYIISNIVTNLMIDCFLSNTFKNISEGVANYG